MMPTVKDITSHETTTNSSVASPLEADKNAIACVHLGMPSEPTDSFDRLKVEGPRQERRDQPPPSAEKVLVHSRRIHSISSLNNVFCDDDSITEEAALDLQRSVASISTEFFRARREPDGTFTRINDDEGPCFYFGQVFVMSCCKSGYIHKDLDTNAVFVTAKHNVAAAAKKDDPNVWEFPCGSRNTNIFLNLPQGKTKQYRMGEIVPQSDDDLVQKEDPFLLREVHTGRFSFWMRKAYWNRGYDISIGPAADIRSWFHDIQRQGLINQIESLEAVDESFPYEPDTKIALLAFCKGRSLLNQLRCVFLDDSVNSSPKEEKSDVQVSEDENSEVQETLILTGEITYNGDHHIEYNINTCRGCSGGPVIIIDPKSNDYKKVIAAHAGYNELLDKNIGFKTNDIFRPTTDEDRTPSPTETESIRILPTHPQSFFLGPLVAGFFLGVLVTFSLGSVKEWAAATFE